MSFKRVQKLRRRGEKFVAVEVSEVSKKKYLFFVLMAGKKWTWVSSKAVFGRTPSKLAKTIPSYFLYCKAKKSTIHQQQHPSSFELETAEMEEKLYLLPSTMLWDFLMCLEWQYSDVWSNINNGTKTLNQNKEREKKLTTSIANKIPVPTY